MATYGWRADWRETEPFETAQEAWLWCCWCESMKGPRQEGGSPCVARPCETNDILIVVKRLVMNKKLTQTHLMILSKFGLKQEPPHEKFGATRFECDYWAQAMRVLGDALAAKGIVERDEDVFGVGACV